MGNSSSSSSSSPGNNKFKSFEDIVDFIATDYILTMNFESLSKLSEKAYCDNLVVLTTDILQRYFNDMEVTYLAQRVKNGVEVNDLESKRMSFVTKNDLENMDVANDAQKSVKKKRVCIGIAKFYVKIAHIFAAIIMTINPVYAYTDQYGNTVQVPLMSKDRIPKNVKRKVYKLNICDNRIRALQRGESVDEDTGNVTLHPRVCDMNAPGSSLYNEPGIPELMRLYLDDEYDYANGTFTGMSKPTEAQFMKDLQTFYTAFTGEAKMPARIQKFSDIKLRDYNQKIGCQATSEVSSLNRKYTINQKNNLFVQYAENTKQMIQRAKANQMKLLDVINLLFTFVIDPFTNKRVIRVNPKLTDATLQQAVENTRKYIINLYVTCEKDYVTGVKLFEAIVESKIAETTDNQRNNLQSKADSMLDEMTPGLRDEYGPRRSNVDFNRPAFKRNLNQGFNANANLNQGFNANANLNQGFNANLNQGFNPNPNPNLNLNLNFNNPNTNRGMAYSNRAQVPYTNQAPYAPQNLYTNQVPYTNQVLRSTSPIRGSPIGPSSAYEDELVNRNTVMNTGINTRANATPFRTSMQRTSALRASPAFKIGTAVRFDDDEDDLMNRGANQSYI